MLVFPQFSSGANVQYPLVRVASNRTVINALLDGSVVKFEDVSAGRARWELRLESLDEAERQSVEQLFLATEGELKSFTLLDPTTNLLSWTEDFSKPVWVFDPLIQAIGGIADPIGGSAAWQVTNSGQASQQVVQAIAAPAGLGFCFSIYARGIGSVNLVRSTTTTGFALTSSWQRISTAGSSSGTGDIFQIAIALDPGGHVQIFGPQLEAQPAAGPYRRSLAAGGVSLVRFDSDRLNTVAVGLDRHSTVIHLVSVEE